METTSAAPISLTDVRTALGDTDPSTTNAGKLRTIIGRGSFATIQKHLEAIRAERVPAPVALPGATPPPPADLCASLWQAAFATAQVATLVRVEQLSAERDTLIATSAAQAQDVAALSGEIDALAAATAASEQSAVAAKAELATAISQAKEQATAQATAMAAAHAEIDSLKVAAQHAADLAVRDSQIARQAMQATIDKLTEQVSELKLLLALGRTEQAKEKPQKEVDVLDLVTAT
jgi:hypothetical protein